MPHNVFFPQLTARGATREGDPMSKDATTNAGHADPRPRTVFGIDSHARTTTICALVVGTGETSTRTFRGNPYAAMSGWMAGFPAPARGFYEARRPCSCCHHKHSGVWTI